MSSLALSTIENLSGNVAITLHSSGVPLLNTPSFRAQATASQSITSATYTKVNIDTVSATNCFDSNGWFNTSTNRYTPQVAGYYNFKGNLYVTGTSQTLQISTIYKNGERYGTATILRLSTSSTITISVSEFIYMNGTTDYVEFYGLVTGTSPSFVYATGPLVTSVFEGFLVRAA